MGKKHRGRGEGSIYRDADGRWRGAVWLGWRANGRPWRKVYSGGTRAEVSRKVTKALRDQQQGLPAADDRLTVAAFLKRWIAAVAGSVRPRTLEFYESMVKHHLDPGLGRVALTALQPEAVEALLARRRAAGLSAGTLKLIRKTLRVALGRAMKWGLVSRNVAALSHAPAGRAETGPVMASKDARAFLESLRGHRNAALYTVALGLGIRQGEILGLRLADYDARAQTVAVAANEGAPGGGGDRVAGDGSKCS